MEIGKDTKKTLCLSSPVIEAICAVLSTFSLEPEHVARMEAVFGKTKIKKIQAQYSQLGETIKGFGARGYELLEFLLVNGEYKALKVYKAQLLSMDDLDFLNHFFGEDIEREKLAGLLEGKLTLEAFQEHHKGWCSDAALECLLTDRQGFLGQFFDCANEFNNQILFKYMTHLETAYQKETEKMTEMLKDQDPLALSQKIMGKTFGRRGPYQQFIFVPVFFLPGKAVRFMGKNQILLYKLMPDIEQKNEKFKIINGLKGLSDESRFDLMALLSEKGPLMGKEIAEVLGLSTPTISHHIEQLREAGFLHEERVKNSKYFSVNHHQVASFIESLELVLKKKE